MTTHLSAAAAISILAAAAISAGAAPQRGDEVRKQFVDLAAKNDRAAIVALWKAHPSAALRVIDQDLEGGLAKIEKDGNADSKELKEMYDRALLGARAADEALGRPIFGEYASSYVGWNAKQQKDFREGQRVSSAARKALRDKSYEDAKKSAQQCIAITTPLGDWWGLASGYGTLADANEGLGLKEEALAARTMSRMLNHDMCFSREELRDTIALAKLLTDLERTVRAKMTIEQGLALAKELKDAKSEEALKGLMK
jgi:hypothetical protein